MSIADPRLFSRGVVLLILVFSFYLSALISLVLGMSVSSLTGVLGGVLHLFGSYAFSRWGLREGIRPWVGDVLVSWLVLATGAWVCAQFPDTSWDGQWYHLDAIWKIREGWNPLWWMSLESGLQALGENVRPMLFYAKFPWLFSAVVGEQFGSIESGKCLGGLVALSTSGIVFGLFFKPPWYSTRNLSLALLALSPVVLAQMPTFYQDGVFALLLLLSLLLASELLRQGPSLALWVPFSIASALCINTKNFGMVHWGIGIVLIFLAYGSERAPSAHRLGLIRWAVPTLILSLFVFGHSPYATNLRSGHFLLYPIEPHWLRTTVREVSATQLPDAFHGKNRFEKLGISVFAKSSGAFPADGSIKIPFSLSRSELVGAGYYDARAGGFGPFFSGVLVLSLLLAFRRLFLPSRSRRALLVFLLGVALILSINPESWWARWSPELGWVPWAVILLAWSESRPWERRVFAFMAIAGLLNLGLVGAGVFKRIRSEQRTYFSYLSELSSHSGKIDVFFGRFDSMRKRLMAREIDFNDLDAHPECGERTRRFPNSPVRYCLREDLGEK